MTSSTCRAASEIVAIGASAGRKVSSRIDPLGIQANVPVFHRRDNMSDWTIDVADAKQEKGKPVPFSRKDGEGKGKASAVNHSNIAPSIDEFSGGVTFDSALQTVVLSLPALRRLRFLTGLDGKPLDGRSTESGAPSTTSSRTSMRGERSGLHCLPATPSSGPASS